MKRIIMSARGVNRLVRNLQLPVERDDGSTFHFGKVEGWFRYAFVSPNPEGGSGKPTIIETGNIQGPEDEARHLAERLARRKGFRERV